MPGVFRGRAPARRVTRPLNPALLGAGATRLASVNAALEALVGAAATKCLLKANTNVALANLVGAATVSTSGTRSASVARVLASLGRAIRADSGIWTVWAPIEVVVFPGAIWDSGASMWDGAVDVYDNDGSIWDPTSPFCVPVPPAAATWAPSAPATARWVEPLR